MITLLAAAGFLTTVCVAAEKPQAVSDTASLVVQAKAVMAQGNRKQALELLDRAAAKSRSKNDQRDIAAKRDLYSQQFITSESFQSYQGAKGLAALERWEECARELDSVGEKDRDNVLVLRQRATCLFSEKQYAAAETAYRAVIALLPGDVEASLGLVEIDVANHQPAAGLAIIDELSPVTSLQIEHQVILSARLLEQSDRTDEAIEVLREDQDKHLDHIAVLYELGMLYTRVPSHDWPARKMLSTFVTRCKRLRETELKARRFDTLLPQAQSAIVTLDKKLGV